MNVKVLDPEGKEVYPIMGSYGIGVGRTLASVIEQSHDENGIIWPMSIAPFAVIIIPINTEDGDLMKTAEKLYEDLSKIHEVLIDDRNERPGVKFKDADLTGIPIRVTIGKSFKEEGKLEIKERHSTEKEFIPMDSVQKRIGEMYENQMARYRN